MADSSPGLTTRDSSTVRTRLITLGRALRHRVHDREPQPAGRRRSTSPSASTRPEAAAASRNANASSSRVRPDRSSAVRPDSVTLSWVLMSWTTAPDAGPRTR
jgi:hypothetical protein